MMCRIKWDDKYFEESGLYVWVFQNGYVESTNEKIYKSALVKLYSQKPRIFNNKNNNQLEGK
ncbi:MAG TPA: hypothetical protein VGK25_14195 [Ignavibacteria bacterium]|jgi:hypothetical protein